MKKIIILSFCLIFVIGIFIIKAKQVQDSSNKITIQFASWGSESEIKILKPLLNNFEKENPNIKIDFLHIPQNYFQKIHLLLASNTAPDVIFINNIYLPIYANANSLEDLTDNDNIFHYEKYFTKSIQALSYKDRIYAVPRDISTLVIYYNKDLFDKYNIQYPKDNWTYDDFLETAKRLNNPPQNFGISFEEDSFFYLPYLMSFGLKGIPSYEDTTTRRGLNLYADLRNKYHVAPLKSESASATMAQMFLQQKLAMHLSGRWLVPKYRQDANFEWDIVEFPQGSSGSVTPADASGWAITKISKHKKEALKLIQYLASEKNSQKFAQSGLIVPARIQVANSEYFLDKKTPKNAVVFINSIDTSLPTPVSIDYKSKMDKLKKQTEYLFNK